MKISLVSVPVKDPVEAHEIYTSKLGFVSHEFDPEAMIAVVRSPDASQSTSILLEPCVGSFAETYQREAYTANLPIILFSAPDIDAKLAELSAAGVTLRPDLDRPEFGMQNLFEDGCGNLIMLIEDAPASN